MLAPAHLQSDIFQNKALISKMVWLLEFNSHPQSDQVYFRCYCRVQSDFSIYSQYLISSLVLIFYILCNRTAPIYCLGQDGPLCLATSPVIIDFRTLPNLK